MRRPLESNWKRTNGCNTAWSLEKPICSLQIPNRWLQRLQQQAGRQVGFWLLSGWLASWVDAGEGLAGRNCYVRNESFSRSVQVKEISSTAATLRAAALQQRCSTTAAALQLNNERAAAAQQQQKLQLHCSINTTGTRKPRAWPA